jgi:hypothetical protein
VRAALNRNMVADGSISPWGGTEAVENALGATAILASEADGPSQGWMGEAATCSGAGQRSEAERRAELQPALLNALRCGAAREKGGGLARCYVGAR